MHRAVLTFDTLVLSKPSSAPLISWQSLQSKLLTALMYMRLCLEAESRVHGVSLSGELQMCSDDTFSA